MVLEPFAQAPHRRGRGVWGLYGGWFQCAGAPAGLGGRSVVTQWRSIRKNPTEEWLRSTPVVWWLWGMKNYPVVITGIMEIIQVAGESRTKPTSISWNNRGIVNTAQLIYPLANVYITTEHHHFLWVNQRTQCMFHSYLSLPEGQCGYMKTWYQANSVGFCSNW